MIKKILCSLLVLFFISIGTTVALAKEKMLIWYPGEAGSTEEASPFLDAFTALLKTKDASIDIEATYLNSETMGLDFIKQKKPLFGIVSYSTWSKNKDQLPNAKIWLATNPLPNGARTEKYSLVGKGKIIGEKTVIFTSEPLSKNFIKNELKLDFENEIEVTQTSQILFKLRQIAKDEIPAVAILTSFETQAFKAMKSPWSRNIRILTHSAAVPTARVILFNESYAKADELKKVLTNMNTDEKAKEILEEMRLKGFSTP